MLHIPDVEKLIKNYDRAQIEEITKNYDSVKRSAFHKSIIVAYMKEFTFSIGKPARQMVARRMYFDLYHDLNKKESILAPVSEEEDTPVSSLSLDNLKNAPSSTIGKRIYTESIVYKCLKSKSHEYIKELISNIRKLAVEDPDAFNDRYEIPNIIQPEDIPCTMAVDIHDKVTFGPNRNLRKSPAVEFQVDSYTDYLPIV